MPSISPLTSCVIYLTSKAVTPGVYLRLVMDKYTDCIATFYGLGKFIKTRSTIIWEHTILNPPALQGLVERF
jgi:hypothetical protein